MTDHLSPEQIAAYRSRTLGPGDLVAADFHLAICDHCRTSVAGVEPDARLLRGVGNAKQLHLSYEQMEGYADGTLDAVMKEFVLSHTALCGRCAKELRDFAEFLPVMDAPVEPKAAKKEARKAPGFWHQLTTAITRTQWAVAGSTAAAVVVAILVLANMPKPGSKQADALLDAQLSSLSPEVRSDVSQIVEAQQGVRPSSLSRLSIPAESKLLVPLGIAVPDQRPTFRWSSIPGTKTVTVFSQAGARIAESGEVDGGEWRVQVPLGRGETYLWVVESGGSVIGQGSFEVLSDSLFREWSEAQTKYAGSHLLLGAMAQHMGMLDEAQREYLSLQLELPQSETAARMLRNLQAIRGR